MLVKIDLIPKQIKAIITIMKRTVLAACLSSLNLVFDTKL